VAVQELESFIESGLTENEIEELLSLGAESIAWVLMELSARMKAEVSSEGNISKPSGQIPVYEKPNIKRRRGKVGAKEGHTGTRRRAPGALLLGAPLF
jgi:hypothetical protein